MPGIKHNLSALPRGRGEHIVTDFVEDNKKNSEITTIVSEFSRVVAENKKRHQKSDAVSFLLYIPGVLIIA